jgi:hypothetical protein
MTAFDDAKTNLSNSAAANRTFLAAQDAIPTLNASLAALKNISDAAFEWTSARISLGILNDNGDQGQGPETLALSQDAAQLRTLIVKARQLVIALATKAETLPLP